MADRRETPETPPTVPILTIFILHNASIERMMAEAGRWRAAGLWRAVRLLRGREDGIPSGFVPGLRFLFVIGEAA